MRRVNVECVAVGTRILLNGGWWRVGAFVDGDCLLEGEDGTSLAWVRGYQRVSVPLQVAANG